jgi:hypothetical protein
MTTQHRATWRRAPLWAALGGIVLLCGSLVLAKTDGPAAAAPVDGSARAVSARHQPAHTAADDRLVITEGGTGDKPAVYNGEGRSVNGITVEADHVVVEGYILERPEAPGIEITGTGITVQNNTISNPQGGDGDGLRFFGEDLKILGNTIKGTSNSDDRHADCMQTFADDSPPSRNVLIEGNRCEDIDNMCLMAEGPNDGEGDGEGHTSDFILKDNYCETLEASQTLMFEDVQHVTISNNTFAAAPDHAIGLAIGSTDAHVEDNTVGPDIGYEVGIDDSSMPGYEGPEPGGQP